VGILSRLAIVLALALAGCYSPDVRDCVLHCGSDSDCASGQSCTADNVCAAPSVTCSGDTSIDASIRMPSVDAMPDAPVGKTVPISVTIDGEGTVMLMGQMCDGTMGGSGSNQQTTCTLSVPPDMPVTAMAMPKPGNYAFTRWTSLVCGAQGASCMFTPIGPTDLSVLFTKTN
jgi:hypothetical protein